MKIIPFPSRPYGTNRLRGAVRALFAILCVALVVWSLGLWVAL